MSLNVFWVKADLVNWFRDEKDTKYQIIQQTIKLMSLKLQFILPLKFFINMKLLKEIVYIPIDNMYAAFFMF